ncbi:G2-specific serine/threonine protein kinase [Arthroderma uncinatum]|uniref:G2-specific serine/threonine protein kinase n=1 Tax=Arthroderma uncinatum TaxID=74035 RepID=UPI00144AAE80|nr:G2-specific serine/threonine protein kinase [Arthroderma uncinatum]KAF3481998.1 G2-specific serine/threonine protein kinase [Arthroderma uncinatum]
MSSSSSTFDRVKRAKEAEALRTRLESLQALEGAYPEFEEIVHHNLDHKYNVVVELRPYSGGYNKAIDIVSRKPDGLVCIRKSFLICSKAKPRRWLREVKATRAMDHPNVEKYLEASISPRKAEIFLEFCDLGTLDYFKQWMATTEAPIPEAFLWHVFRQLIRALSYMQTGLRNDRDIINEDVPDKNGWNAILHRDIKLDNIFIKSPDVAGEYPIIKFGDFGMSVSKKDLKMPFATSGTEGWMAPEFPNCSKRSDVFSATAVIQCLSVVNWCGADPMGGVGETYSEDLHSCVLAGMTKTKADRPRIRELARLVYPVDLPPFEAVPNEAFVRLLPPREDRAITPSQLLRSYR